jgi:hypothetical protein
MFEVVKFKAVTGIQRGYRYPKARVDWPTDRGKCPRSKRVEAW